jgi:hypothetical protein
VNILATATRVQFGESVSMWWQHKILQNRAMRVEKQSHGKALGQILKANA